jgi:hypothetical protein
MCAGAEEVCCMVGVLVYVLVVLLLASGILAILGIPLRVATPETSRWNRIGHICVILCAVTLVGVFLSSLFVLWFLMHLGRV